MRKLLTITAMALLIVMSGITLKAESTAAVGKKAGELLVEFIF